MATRPERRPRDQDRRRAARCRPVFPFGIGTKAAKSTSFGQKFSPRYLTTPVCPFHAEPLHLCHNICCLIQSTFELGIEPTFWGKDAARPTAIVSEPEPVEAEADLAWAWV